MPRGNHQLDDTRAGQTQTSKSYKASLQLRLDGQLRSVDDMPQEEVDALCRACRAVLPTKLPRGQRYQIIYADPPWRYQPLKFDAATAMARYPTMTEEEICALPVARLCDKPCVLLLWATGPMMDRAIRVMERWGFRYNGVFKLWRKVTKGGTPVCGPGWWTKGNHEFLLLGVRGQVGRLKAGVNDMYQEFREEDRNADFTCQRAGLRHSAKPPAIRDHIDRFFRPDARRIELFARDNRSPAWDAWGLEVPGFFCAATAGVLDAGARAAANAAALPRLLRDAQPELRAALAQATPEALAEALAEAKDADDGPETEVDKGGCDPAVCADTEDDPPSSPAPL
jgi:N6-adenosine-specific RNA methylase IME4